MHKIYLSRRNLLTLLSKLDRKAGGEETKCTIKKYRNPDALAYIQTMDGAEVTAVESIDGDKYHDQLEVTAVEDEDFYRLQQRPAGGMHPADEANNGPIPSTGIGYHLGL